MQIKISSWFWDALLFLLFFVGFPVAVLTGLYYPSVFLDQGTAHRIFYFHVPVAWVALYAPIISAVCGCLYLWKRRDHWDVLSYSANKVALLFAIGVLVSGRIWAKSAWGTPWDWTDARLQSFFALVLTLLAYFVLRMLIPEQKKKQLFSAFLSILCAVNAVITWGAIRWIDNPGNHPSSVLGKGGMEPEMRIAFWSGVLAYHLLFLVIFRIVYRSAKIAYVRLWASQRVS